MDDRSDTVAALVRYFETIEREHMQGLPIVNRELAVEAVGFRDFAEHTIGILISPWFMNLVLLPGTDEWSASPQGDTCELSLPGELLEFAVCHDDELGTYLSAVLFRSVDDFPDQATARAVARDVLDRVFTQRTGNDGRNVAGGKKVVSRRELLTGLGAR